MSVYDLIVIGSGTAAQVAVGRVRAAGWSVAVIDHRPFGGTCALRGCDPKKMLVSGEEAIDAAARVSPRCTELFGLDGTGVEFGPEAARALGSVQVKALDFPLELNFTTDGRAAFKRALAENRALESIRICATRLDGSCAGGWSAEGSPFFADVQRLRRRGKLEPIVVLGADDVE